MSPTARTSSSAPGHFAFGVFELFAGSTFHLPAGMGLQLNSGTIDIKFGSNMAADYFNITTAFLDVESGAVLSCAGGDRPNATTLAPGPGRTGGSHGSPGGDSSTAQGVTDTIAPPPTGTIFAPTLPGADGIGLGDSLATDVGHGGGVVRVQASLVVVDGTITAAGASPAEGKRLAGGGSGGSIYATTPKFEGFGNIDVRGGGGLERSCRRWCGGANRI